MRKPICRHLPRVQRSWIYPVLTLQHTRGKDTTEPKVSVKQTKADADICSRKEEHRFITSSDILLYYSSDASPFSVSLSVLSVCRLPDCRRGFSPDRSEMPLTGSAASDWRQATRTQISRPQIRPRAGRESTPARKKSPPATPSGSGDRPRCTLSDRGE